MKVNNRKALAAWFDFAAVCFFAGAVFLIVDGFEVLDILVFLLADVLFFAARFIMAKGQDETMKEERQWNMIDSPGGKNGSGKNTSESRSGRSQNTWIGSFR